MNPNWTTYPWIVDSKGKGDNWTVCSVGRSNIDGKDYEVTTDHVHASELEGDARDDAYLIARAPQLFNSLLEMCGLAISMWSSLTDIQKQQVEKARGILDKSIAPKPLREHPIKNTRAVHGTYTPPRKQKA